MSTTFKVDLYYSLSNDVFIDEDTFLSLGTLNYNLQTLSLEICHKMEDHSIESKDTAKHILYKHSFFLFLSPGTDQWRHCILQLGRSGPLTLWICHISEFYVTNTTYILATNVSTNKYI